MESTDTKKTAKDRKIKNYLLFPKVQMKYAALYCSLMVLLGFVIIGLQLSMNREVLANIGNSEMAEIIANLQTRNLILQSMILVLSTGLIFLITVVTIHRFMGPIISIIRYFETIRLNGHAKPIEPRDEDELEPLITYLRSVEIKVSQKDSI